jgi:hypothetical protein
VKAEARPPACDLVPVQGAALSVGAAGNQRYVLNAEDKMNMHLTEAL